MGFRTGVGFADEKFPALALFNLLLGGEANSLLFRSVREKSGLCYSIGSWLEALCGMMFVSAAFEEDNLMEVLGGIDDQLEAVRNGRFEVEEMEAAKSIWNWVSSVSPFRGGLRNNLWNLRPVMRKPRWNLK